MKEFSTKYFDLLTGDYAGINLTRINDFDDFYIKQIRDSIEPYEQSELFKTSLKQTKLLIDVGFGGGFPILPLAKLLPDTSFIGIETRNKKVTVVGEIAGKLGLKNVNLLHSRIENIVIDRPATISFKAVGKVNDFLSRLNLEYRCQVYFYKGPNFYEIEADQLVEAKKTWKVIEEKSINLPGVDKRYLIGFENLNVPCGTVNKKVNNLVKLSELL